MTSSMASEPTTLRLRSRVHDDFRNARCATPAITNISVPGTPRARRYDSPPSDVSRHRRSHPDRDRQSGISKRTATASPMTVSAHGCLTGEGHKNGCECGGRLFADSEEAHVTEA